MHVEMIANHLTLTHYKIHDQNVINKLCAWARVVLQTIWSALAIYPSCARRTCNMSSPDTICHEQRMPNDDASQKISEAGISPHALAVDAAIRFSLFFWGQSEISTHKKHPDRGILRVNRHMLSWIQPPLKKLGTNYSKLVHWYRW